jgi:predicted outer membrane repeat protein
MKKQIHFTIKAHVIRGGAFYLLLVSVCAIPFALAQRNAPNRNAVPANIIVVTNTNDSGTGSLRDALAAANDGDTIDATGVSGTILLTSGELQINHNVTINGPGAGNLAVNSNATSRVFENFASNVTISGFTITNGLVIDDSGGGILNHGGLTLSDSSILSNGVELGKINFGNGGGIASSGGTLTVTNSVISNNSAPSGGGVYADGAVVTVSNSTINGNGADGGGGIATNNAQLTVMNSTINGNNASGNMTLAPGQGGGVLNGGGTLTVTNSTISDNLANGNGGGQGGGVLNGGGTLTVTNSTISGNGVGTGVSGSGEGGGVYNSGGTLTVTNSTISGNLANGNGSSEGGGIYNSAGTLAVTNSTFSGNLAPPAQGGAIFNAAQATVGDAVLNAGTSGGTIFNNGGTVTSLGYNLASDNGGGVLTGPGDQINTDPMLGPLQDNGGPTFTHALLPGSPAIDVGDPNFTPPPFFDQRGPGFHRMVNGRIDKGSFEVQAQRPAPTPRLRPTPAPRP